MIPELQDWKYNKKTKGYNRKTEYADYYIVENAKDGICLKWTLLKVYSSPFYFRHTKFYRDHLKSIDDATQAQSEIDIREAERYVRKLRRRCSAKWSRRYQLIKKFGSKCKECGYDKQRPLQFHHIDSSEKDLYSKNKEASLDEVEKHPERFKMLCANCHIILHSNQNSINREFKIINTKKKYRKISHERPIKLIQQ